MEKEHLEFYVKRYKKENELYEKAMKDLGRKVMHTSNLAMRFYVHDGWTLEELNEVLIKGSFHLMKIEQDPNDPSYYVLDAHSTVDVDKLDKKVSIIKKAFDDYPNETNKECIKRFNW